MKKLNASCNIRKVKYMKTLGDSSIVDQPIEK
jgi:hypothetical protein